MSDRDERGYSFPYDNQAYVTRRTRLTEVEMDFDADGLAITVESGSGYGSMTCNAVIHTDVLIELMNRAGYTVTRSE